MNIVQSGENFYVYGEDVQTYKQLPAKTYRVCYNDQLGFYLTLHNELNVSEKVYGNYQKKVSKVMKSFRISKRNMGVILSGPKGAGKSMFAKLLAKEGAEEDIPLIIVDKDINGVQNFISSIKQESIILFDEFEKVYGMKKDDELQSPQDKLLSLFDGIDNGKKLYIITCNNADALSSYLINRPGRFHYHFRILPPSEDEIREYMNDRLNDPDPDVIDKVIAISQVGNFTYDILRAIAFDLNQGYPLDETMNDLNIEKAKEISMNIKITLENGNIWRNSGYWSIKINDKEDSRIRMEPYSSDVPDVIRALHARYQFDLHVHVQENDIIFKNGKYQIEHPEHISISVRSYSDLSDDNRKLLEDYEKLKVISVELSRAKGYDYSDIKFGGLI